MQLIQITARDCCDISNASQYEDALLYFSTIDDFTILNLFKNQKDREPIVYYDFQHRKWFAGRYVGECDFEFNNTKYRLTIEPRFGRKILSKLFEYVYKVKLPKSYHTIEQSQSIRDIHKMLICVIWVNLFSKSAKNGLLKERRIIKEEGNIIKGKFLIRDSYRSIKTQGVVKYQYADKTIDNTPNQIIFKAYTILLSRYNLNISLLPISIRAYINEISQAINNKSITISDYKKIRYNSIYLIYKPLVDFSWDIIQKNSFNSKESKQINYNFFLDMAEVWENFIGNILKIKLISTGWSSVDNKVLLYKDKLFQRNIIPDFIFKNGDKILVLDAKYKRMKGDWYDLDREDFFQIHTYSYYFSKSSSIIFSGLIYPLTVDFDEKLRDKCISTIFNTETKNNYFFVEGIEIANEDLFDEKVIKFVESVNDIVNI